MAMFRCGGGEKNVITGTFKPPQVGESAVNVNLGFRPSAVFIYSAIYQRTTKDARRFTGVIDGIDCGEFTMSGQDSPVAYVTSEIAITDTGFSFTASGNGQWNQNSDALYTYFAIKT